MRVAVTGAGGLTGGKIVERLVEQGHQVVRIVRRELGSREDAVIADCRDRDGLAAAMGGCDLLVHVAGIALGASVAGAIERAGTPRVLAVSTAAVHSRHRVAVEDYLRGEEALRTTRPDAVIVRPTMIYGSSRDRNVHHVIEFARRYRFLPVIGEGSALIQPIHFEDLARAVALLVDRPDAGTVEAGGGSVISVRSAARIILLSLGLPPRIVQVPFGLALGAAKVVESVRGGRVVERVERMREDRSVDNTRLQMLTGLQPRSFDEGVRTQVAIPS